MPKKPRWLRDRTQPVPEMYRAIRRQYGDRILAGELTCKALRGLPVEVDGETRAISQRGAEHGAAWVRQEPGGRHVGAGPVEAAPVEVNSPDAVPGEGPSDSGEHVELAGERHLFTWSFDGIPRSVVLTDAELRDIIRQYVSRDQGGLGETMQQVAVRHRLTRRDFHKIKSLYGLTKQHEPFTRNDMATRDVGSLADEQLALKRQQLLARVEREDLSQLRRMAGKWQALQEGILDPFADLVERVTGGSVPLGNGSTADTDSAPGAWAGFYQGSDLHYGLLVDSRLNGGGTVYNREIARERWWRGLREAVEHGIRAYGRGSLDRWFIGVGGDIAHVDNVHALTTSMRHHQDMDGLPHTLIQEIVEFLYIPAIEFLLGLDEDLIVEVVGIPGNHDGLSARAFMTAVWARFRDHPRVRFTNMHSSHAFIVYGETLLVGHHGHGESKAKEFASTADVYLRQAGESARYRYAITGNLHHLHTKESDGMILIQQPAPPESDVYHATNGWDKSRPATLGAYFSPTGGLLGLRYIGW